MKYSLGYALLLASWMQSLHVGPWVSWHSEIPAISALLWFAGGVYLFSLRSQSVSRIHVPAMVLFPAALLLCVWFQFAVGLIEFAGDALVISAYLIFAVLALIVGYQWGDKTLSQTQNSRGANVLAHISITVLLGAVLSVVVALVQVFDVWGFHGWIASMDGYRRPGSNLGQTNHFASLELMGLVSLIYLQQTRVLTSVPSAILLALLMVGLALSESRTALISSIVLTGWWFWKRALFMRPVGHRVVGAIWLGYLFLLWWWPQFITQLQLIQVDEGGGGGRTLSNLGNLGVRQIVWTQLTEAVMERPILGWGFGGISEALSAVLHRHTEGGPFTYAHNVVLDLTIGVGVPAAALFLVLFGYWTVRRLSGVNTQNSWYCWALAIPLAVHSTLEFPYAYAYFLVPVLLCLGFQEAGLRTKPTLTLSVHQYGGLLLIFTLLIVWSAVEYLKIEEDYSVARFEALRVGKTPDAYERPEVILLTQLGAVLDAARVQPVPNMPKGEIKLLRETAMRYPWSSLQNRYALALALNGEHEEATRILLVIRAMHGRKHYENIKQYWLSQTTKDYPQLKAFELP